MICDRIVRNMSKKNFKIPRSFTRRPMTLIFGCFLLICIIFVCKFVYLTWMNSFKDDHAILGTEYSQFKLDSWNNLHVKTELPTLHADDFQVIGNGNFVGILKNSTIDFHVINHNNKPPFYIDTNVLFHLRLDEFIYSTRKIGELSFVRREQGILQIFQALTLQNNELMKLDIKIFIHRLRDVVSVEINYHNLKSEHVEIDTVDIRQLFNINWKRNDNKSICSDNLKYQVCLESNDDFKTKFTVKPNSIRKVLIILGIGTDISGILQTYDEFVKLHKQCWHLESQKMFEIEHTYAPGHINEHQINNTIYYLNSLCMYSSALPKYDVGCYSHHSTLEAHLLWKKPKSIGDMNNILWLWTITMRKHKCSLLFDSGSSGRHLAIMLSIGSIKITEHHTEMNMDASMLWRKFKLNNIPLLFGRIQLQNELDEDHKSQIFVKYFGNKSTYICGAGCDYIQEVSGLTHIHVKTTMPRNALLYISQEKDHLEELKDALHIRGLKPVDPFNHNVIALHKHGHKYGGLPVYFWLLVIGLVIVFHAIIFNFIYKELSKPSSKGYRITTRYY